MMNKPLVSVVIPAYNCEKYISVAIDSVLSQNVPLEIIVIDDCSKDSLFKVMKKYVDNDDVIFVQNDVNLGAAATRNKGVSMAKGEFVAFLDADDYWMSDKLEKQIALIKQNDCVMCATARELINPNGSSTKKNYSRKRKYYLQRFA